MCNPELENNHRQIYCSTIIEKLFFYCNLFERSFEYKSTKSDLLFGFFFLSKTV